MKLYTEEQVNKIATQSMSFGRAECLMALIMPPPSLEPH